MSFPIVYSLEGDHDPNGLLYTLQAYKPLLKWAKEQWESGGEYLPKLHRRIHLMETVVYGLPRYKQMRRILADGPVEHRYLLGEFGDETDVWDRDRRDRHRPKSTPRERAIRQNYRATVDELVSALKELTSGRIAALLSDPGVLDEWHQQWLDQLTDAERALEGRLQQIDLGQFLEKQQETKETSRLSAALVRRLIFNDHTPNPDYDPATHAPHPYDRFNPLKPIPLVRPLVLRACRGEIVKVHFSNEIRGREVGVHVQGGGLAGGVADDDGAHVGRNTSSLVAYKDDRTYTWHCQREGVWPINDLGDVRGTDRGTNNHGLFGALIVEPKESRWYDSETGEQLDDTADSGPQRDVDLVPLYVDVVPRAEWGLKDNKDQEPVKVCPDDPHTCTPKDRCRRWREENFVDFHYSDPDLSEEEQAKDCSFREFTIFFHDETETHSGIPHPLPHSAMPLSYRAEPMHNRMPYRLHGRIRAQAGTQPEPDSTGIDHSRVKVELNELLGEKFWVARDLSEETGTPSATKKDEHGNPILEYRDDAEGKFLERVSGEEQHHSAWLFGESVTPILRAYKGDPCRVRLVHAGVKETHVFHLHVHQWRAVPQDTALPSVWKPGDHHGSQLLDSISIGPQTGMTIDPLYGSGSRQHAVGDIIWHCHLYPHFHHGMWGLWRSFDRLIDGSSAYPDGTPCAPLLPLPGRAPDSASDDTTGFPWFIDADYPRKSPPPPSPRKDKNGQGIHVDGRRQLLRMDHCSKTEEAAFAPGCKGNEQPGALFVDLDGMARTWNNKAELPEQRIISYDITMASRPLAYNSAGWHDPHGHHYALTGVAVTKLDDNGKKTIEYTPPRISADGGVEAFFPRANHGDIVELRMHNTVGTVDPDEFDFLGHPVECGLHVHLVKFDVLAADGSASGWNYMSGASSPKAIGPDQAGKSPRNVSLHRWVVDEEFGTCFFHDHLLANFRQKRGLFAALIAEPVGTRWYLPDQKTLAWVGSQAVIMPRKNGAAGIAEPFREAGLAIGDFVPLHRRNGDGLNEPQQLGGDDDPGVMGVNYRCAPMEYRGKDPSEWFSSNRSAAGDGTDLKWGGYWDAQAGGPLGSRRRYEGRKPLDVTDASPYLPVPLKDRGDPDTPVIYTYPGERLRIRVFQGSHEEQHSFMLNGLRWRKDWHNPRSLLVNQQTLGISEAFTVDIDPQFSPYAPGDYLWQFTVLDDLWLGCWGLIRALQPSENVLTNLPPLPRRQGGRFEPLHDLQPDEIKAWCRWFASSKSASRSVPDRPIPDEDDAERPLLGRRPNDTEPSRYLPEGARVREYTVVARRHEHLFAGHDLTDPWGLIYRVVVPTKGDVVEWEKYPEKPHNADEQLRHTGNLRVILARDNANVGAPGGDTPAGTDSEPLVLRAHRGEWLRVRLINEVLLPEENEESYPDQHHPTADPYLPPFGPEVNPPRVPEEHRDHLGYPDRRTVSPRVSLHPCLLRYDVVSDDGSYVGHNHDSTVAALDVGDTAHVAHGGHDQADLVAHRTDHGIGHRDSNWRDYWWYADDLLAPKSHDGGPGQVCYLFDMADIRNHRHHGLIGAIIIEPDDVIPCDPTNRERHAYIGSRAVLRERRNAPEAKAGEAKGHQDKGNVVAQEHVLFLQDGLRHFLRGDIDQPVPDVSPSDPPVDAGQKAISYRSPLTPTRNPLVGGNPPPPVIGASPDRDIWLRLVCAGDKPRNHTFTVHGFAWNPALWVKPGYDAGALGAISAGYAHDLILRKQEGLDAFNGDHCYRSGAFRWAVTQGMWGILRIPSDPPQRDLGRQPGL